MGGGGDRAKPHPKLFSTPVQSLSRPRKLHSSVGPPPSLRACVPASALPPAGPSRRKAGGRCAPPAARCPCPCPCAGSALRRARPRPQQVMGFPTQDPDRLFAPLRTAQIPQPGEGKHFTGSPAGTESRLAGFFNLRHTTSFPNRLIHVLLNSQLPNILDFGETP